MSDQATPSVPAGWYADPQDPARGRYWDGVAWTEHYHSPGQPVPAPRAPEGTEPLTPWIWAILALPILTSIPVLFIPWDSFFDYDPRDTQGMLDAQFSIFTSPAYLAMILLGFATWALTVLFAYLDHRELSARQVPKPFHWAWAFIPSYGTYVYVIGRSVVTRMRLGGDNRALIPIWVLIGTVVLGFVLGFVVMFQVMAGMTEMFSTLR